MAQLRVFNVGHGETMFLHLDNHVDVIRDLGRSKYAIPTDTSISIDRVLECCHYRFCFHPFQKEPTDTVLSHAHEDHFNGFIIIHKEGFRKIFRNSYIPWLDFNTVNSLGGQILKLSLYLYTYLNLNHPVGIKIKNWILIAPILLELSKRLYGVCSGYNITNWQPVGQILWPPPPAHNYYSNKVTNISNRISEIENNINDPELIADFTKHIYEPIFSNLKRIYPEKSDGYTLNENIENTGVDIITERLDQTESFRQRFGQARIKTGTILSHTWTLDDHSLVFQLAENSTPTSLFLSDLTAKRIDQMLSLNNLSNIEYNLIKSAHHGTRFSNKLMRNNITAKQILHCCGPAHPNWYGPNDQYSNISSDIICTDWKNNSTRWPAIRNSRIFKRCCEGFAI